MPPKRCVQRGNGKPASRSSHVTVVSADDCPNSLGVAVFFVGNDQLTIWLFNIAMENASFIDDFHIKTSIYSGFSMAMLNNQSVIFSERLAEIDPPTKEGARSSEQ